jgi:hypothetical protein
MKTESVTRLEAVLQFSLACQASLGSLCSLHPVLAVRQLQCNIASRSAVRQHQHNLASRLAVRQHQCSGKAVLVVNACACTDALRRNSLLRAPLVVVCMFAFLLCSVLSASPPSPSPESPSTPKSPSLPRRPSAHHSLCPSHSPCRQLFCQSTLLLLLAMRQCLQQPSLESSQVGSDFLNGSPNI